MNLGTTHAEDVQTLVNRTVEQGLPSYLLRELDLVVFPRHVGDERYVGEVVEFVDPAGPDLPGAGGHTVKDGEEVAWNRVAHRDHDGEFQFAGTAGVRFFERIADATDRPVSEVESEFERKRRYVEYMVREGMTEFDSLFAFLSDLRNEEAATVERLRQEEAGTD